MVQFLTAEAAKLLVESFQARDLSLHKQIQSPYRRLGQAQAGSVAAGRGGRHRRVRHGPQRWGRPTAGKEAAGVRRQGAAGEGNEANEARQAVSKGRGTHSQSDSHWLGWGGAVGLRGSGLHSNTAPSCQSRRGQSHKSAQPRTERSHNDAGQRPGKRGTKHCFDITDNSFWLGRWEFGKALQTSTQCRLRSAALSPGSVISSGRGAAPRTQRPFSCLRFCGWDRAPSRRGISIPTVRRLTSWQWRRRRWAFGWTRLPFFVVRQLCTLEPVQGSALLGSHQATSCFRQAGGVVTLASERAGQAGLPRHLDPGEACAAQGRGRRQLPAVQRRTRHHVPRLPRVPGLAGRNCYVRMYVSQEVRQAARSLGSQCREQFAHGIFLDPAAILPTGFPERACPVCGSPEGLSEGHIFKDGSSWGSGARRRAGWAVVAVDDVGNLKAAAYGAVPSDVLPGQTSRDGEDFAAAMAGHITLDPLTLYIDREGTIATVNGPKHKAF